MGRDTGVAVATARGDLGTDAVSSWCCNPTRGTKEPPQGSCIHLGPGSMRQQVEPPPRGAWTVGALSLLSVFVGRVWGAAGAEARLESLQWHRNWGI